MNSKEVLASQLAGPHDVQRAVAAETQRSLPPRFVSVLEEKRPGPARGDSEAEALNLCVPEVHIALWVP